MIFFVIISTNSCLSALQLFLFIFHPQHLIKNLKNIHILWTPHASLFQLNFLHDTSLLLHQYFHYSCLLKFLFSVILAPTNHLLQVNKTLVVVLKEDPKDSVLLICLPSSTLAPEFHESVSIHIHRFAIVSILIQTHRQFMFFFVVNQLWLRDLYCALVSTSTLALFPISRSSMRCNSL